MELSRDQHLNPISQYVQKSPIINSLSNKSSLTTRYPCNSRSNADKKKSSKPSTSRTPAPSHILCAGDHASRSSNHHLVLESKTRSQCVQSRKCSRPLLLGRCHGRDCWYRWRWLNSYRPGVCQDSIHDGGSGEMGPHSSRSLRSGDLHHSHCTRSHSLDDVLQSNPAQALQNTFHAMQAKSWNRLQMHCSRNDTQRWPS